MIKNVKKFPDFKIDPDTELGKILVSIKLYSFHEVLNFLYNLSYSRISDLENLKLVALEKCGTCSSKHAFAAKVAVEHGYHEILLKLVVFPLYSSFLPGFQKELLENSIDHILEAHCYLEYQGVPLDITTSKVDVTPYYVNTTPILVRTLKPSEAGEYKQKLHKELFSVWCQERGLNYEKMWDLRSRFIKSISKRAQS